MYDVDGNGWIDLVEMTKIVRSIYKMMGPNQALVDQFETPEKRAEDIFRRMDANSDGRVTRQEFVRSCLNDSKLAELLSPRYISWPSITSRNKTNAALMQLIIFQIVKLQNSKFA